MTYLLQDEAAYFARLRVIEHEHWWSRGMWRIAFGYLDIALRGLSNVHALDIGCGAGGTLRKLAAMPQIERVSGIDPSPTALELTGDWDVSHGSVLDLPYRDREFDLVTCFDVLQHLAAGEDSHAMCEIHRVLRPNGIAILRTNGRGLWPDPSRSDVLYDLRSLRHIARNADLSLVHSSYANCLPSIATEILGKLARMNRRGRPAGDHGHPQGRGLRIRPVNKSLDRFMGAIAATEAIAITRLGWTLPIGHSIVALLQKPGGAA